MSAIERSIDAIGSSDRGNEFSDDRRSVADLAPRTTDHAVCRVPGTLQTSATFFTGVKGCGSRQSVELDQAGWSGSRRGLAFIGSTLEALQL
jgi:hypothetical protein